MIYRNYKKLIAFSITIVLLGILLGGCIGGDRFQPQGWSGPIVSEGTIFANSMTGRLLALDKTNRAQTWQFKPEEEESGGISLFSCGATTKKPLVTYGTPTISGDTLFVGSYGGKLYSVNTKTGINNWEFDTEGHIVGSVAISNGTVVVGSSNGKIYALNSTNGTMQWNAPFSTSGMIWSDIVIEGNRIYVGDLEHKLHVIDLKTGLIVWEREFGGGIASTPVIVDNVIYVGTFESKFYALDASNGNDKWVEPFDAENWFWTTPLIENGTVYVGSLDKNFYALNARTGQLKWTKSTGGEIRSQAVLVDGVLIFASNDGKVYGLDPGTGREKWAPRDLDNPVLANAWADTEDVYFIDQKNILHAVAAKTGLEIWSFSLEENGD